jgi:hypothetical protein
MKAVVDRLSEELANRYLPYIETLLVDLWSERGVIEFRCGFTLRCDHALRQFTLKLPADDGETDAERELLIIVIFEQIEQLIDEAIAEPKTGVN